jgi:hypothetical protein
MIIRSLNHLGKVTAVVLAAVLMMAGPSYANGQGFMANAKQVKSKKGHKATAKQVVTPLTAAFTYPAASHVAQGASLRNRASSTINLSGIPADATIIQAFLYWDFTSLTSVTSKQTTLCFGKNKEGGDGGEDDAKESDSNDQSGSSVTWSTASDSGESDDDSSCASDLSEVTGTQIGTGDDACWAGGSNFAFRADVTKAVSGNGRYTVGLQSGATSTQSGISPFDPTSPAVGPYAEGASLVVVFSSTTIPNGQTLIYDAGIAGTMFISVNGLSYSLGAVPATGTGQSLFTEIGGDGQPGMGALAFIADKETSLNGKLIAGPGSPANDSDWNGSDGHPLPQMWDTNTHDVTGDLLTGTNAVLVLDPISKGGDCDIGIANVLTVR